MGTLHFALKSKGGNCMGSLNSFRQINACGFEGRCLFCKATQKWNKQIRLHQILWGLSASQGGLASAQYSLLFQNALWDI